MNLKTLRKHILVLLSKCLYTFAFKTCTQLFYIDQMNISKYQIVVLLLVAGEF